jgi:hypothetical protein
MQLCSVWTSLLLGKQLNILTLNLDTFPQIEGGVEEVILRISDINCF